MHVCVFIYTQYTHIMLAKTRFYIKQALCLNKCFFGKTLLFVLDFIRICISTTYWSGEQVCIVHFWDVKYQQFM